MLFSLTDITTCTHTGSSYTSYIKMVSYNTTIPDSGIKTSAYVGTDSSTDTCTAPTGVSYEVLPFDTCLYNALYAQYLKITSCDGTEFLGAYWLHIHYAVCIYSVFTV